MHALQSPLSTGKIHVQYCTSWSSFIFPLICVQANADIGSPSVTSTFPSFWNCLQKKGLKQQKQKILLNTTARLFHREISTNLLTRHINHLQHYPMLVKIQSVAVLPWAGDSREENHHKIRHSSKISSVIAKEPLTGWQNARCFLILLRWSLSKCHRRDFALSRWHSPRRNKSHDRKRLYDDMVPRITKSIRSSRSHQSSYRRHRSSRSKTPPSASDRGQILSHLLFCYSSTIVICIRHLGLHSIRQRHAQLQHHHMQGSQREFPITGFHMQVFTNQVRSKDRPTAIKTDWNQRKIAELHDLFNKETRYWWSNLNAIVCNCVCMHVMGPSCQWSWSVLAATTWRAPSKQYAWAWSRLR